MPRSSKFSSFISGFILLAFANACSVSMALQGEEDPDLSVLRPGATREQVELQFGESKKIEKGENGTTIIVYQYLTGDTPSSLRAFAHGVMDVATLCLWEFAGMYIEARHGTIITIVVYYDSEDTVTAIRKLDVEL